MTQRRGWHEGTIFNPSKGKWRAQITINGKRVSHTGNSKSECASWIHSVREKAFKDQNNPYSVQILKEFLVEWFDSKQMTIRPNTATQCEQTIRTHIVPNIGQVRLCDLNLEMIDHFYSDLQLKGTSVRTIRLVHSVLHVALERAARYNLIVRNPTHGATVPRQEQKEMMALDEEQVSRLLAAASGNRLYILFHLAVVTGMRQGELLGLKWSDVSLDKGHINIKRQVQRQTGEGFVFSEPKTRSGRRKIGIGSYTIDLLRHQKILQDGLRVKAKDAWQEDDLVFTSAVGTPLDQRNVLREFQSVLQVAGLPKIRFHDLRPTAASLLLNNGQGVIAVSKLLGHSNPSVTVNIYAHVYNETMDEVARTMDRLVSPIPISLPENKPVETLTKPEGAKLHQIAPVFQA